MRGAILLGMFEGPRHYLPPPGLHFSPFLGGGSFLSLRPRGGVGVFRAVLELEACAHFHARLLRAERGDHRPDPRGHAPERGGTGAGEGGLVFGASGRADAVDAGPAAGGELKADWVVR